ncbi:MAG: hypothetical protein SGILL_001457, partial [Bacillariaceae sp.]
TPISETSSTSSWLEPLDSVEDLKEGDLVVSRIESSLGCHDLRQPYFHKAVVLILDHDAEDFTQGVLLNRASDLVLSDQDIVYEDEESDNETTTDEAVSSSNPWRIHFGGDIGSWYDEIPNFVCLHTVASDAALRVSDQIFVEDGTSSDNNIYITSHYGARTLIESGEATSDDFFTFSGFCGWEEGQLQREVDRGSWYIASPTSPRLSSNRKDDADTTPSRLWQMMREFSWKNTNYHPQSGGIRFWENVMKELGKDLESGKANAFSDLMLKQWATERLLVDKGDSLAVELDDIDIFTAMQAVSSYRSIAPGCLLRGSSSSKCPYLLKEQLFHKSTILLLDDADLHVSVGVILNIPTTDSYNIMVNEESIKIPIRYGGPSGKPKEQPLMFFHSDHTLKAEGVGRPVDANGDCKSDVYVCAADEIVKALEDGLDPSGIIAVQGFCTWEKEMGSGGILGELASGNLEAVSVPADKVFDSLLAQQLMSKDSLESNIWLAMDAWKRGTATIPEGGQDTDRLVYESCTHVSKLTDDALKVWIEIFILGNGEYSDYVE